MLRWLVSSIGIYNMVSISVAYDDIEWTHDLGTEHSAIKIIQGFLWDYTT